MTTPTHVSTYTFVNPVVAVFLGWLLAGEPLTWNTIIAAFVIVSGVAMITASQMRMLARAVKPQVKAGTTPNPLRNVRRGHHCRAMNRQPRRLGIPSSGRRSYFESPEVHCSIPLADARRARCFCSQRSVIPLKVFESSSPVLLGQAPSGLSLSVHLARIAGSRLARPA